MNKHAFRIVGGAFSIIAIFLVSMSFFSGDVIGQEEFVHPSTDTIPYTSFATFEDQHTYPLSQFSDCTSSSEEMFDPSISGTIYFFDSNSIKTSLNDKCSRDSVRDYYCDDEGRVSYVNYKCVHGCTELSTCKITAPEIVRTPSVPVSTRLTKANNPYASFTTFERQRVYSSALTNCRTIGDFFDPSVSGSVSFSNSRGDYAILNDRCSNNRVRDYYCDADEKVSYTSYRCLNGCKDANNCATS